MVKIKHLASHVYVVAYKEDTSRLEDYFGSRGFVVKVLRRAYPPDELSLPSQVRCLLNHRDTWREIEAAGHCAIVVEADFVPVRDFEEAPAPFDPRHTPAAVGWLYAGGPVFYGFDQAGYAIGHSSTAVALLITPKTACGLLDFAEAEMADYKPDILLWDTYHSHFLRLQRGVATYIPFKQYGDHGGIPNRDHAGNMQRIWHQGDVMLGPLAFLPLYAEGSWIRFRIIRIRAALRGLYRVFNGRFIEAPGFRASNQKLPMLRFTLARWLPWTRSFSPSRPGS
ncbi:MAG: hypothetical protein ACKO8I_18150 [Cyanobacteriota bacterium]